jgi:hypothetical protein
MRRSILHAAVVLAALGLTRPAYAPPPIGGFPASLLPASGSTAPANTLLWAFGTGAPAPAQTDLTLTLDGAPVPLEKRRYGCCTILGARSAATSGMASALARGAQNEVPTTFTITATVDTRAPELTSARVLDDDGLRLLIGTEGIDDLGLGAFAARVDGAVVNAVPPGLLLEVRARCADIVAVDLAGHESAPQRVCGAIPDAGVPSDGGQADTGATADAGGTPPDSEGCSTTRGTPGLGLGLGLLLALRRRRVRATA